MKYESVFLHRRHLQLQIENLQAGTGGLLSLSIEAMYVEISLGYGFADNSRAFS